MAEHVLFEIKDNIAYLMLDSPPKNEMGEQFFDRLLNIQKMHFDNLQVEGMIVHGNGRHFSSGAILNEITDLTKVDSLTKLTKYSECFQKIASFKFPVVAAIMGCCIGSGLELALACHYRVAAHRAVFSLPESTFGLIPGCGGTARLSSIVGRGAAIHMLLTGEMFLAEDALRMGLVDLVVQKNELINSALTIITKLNGKNYA